MTKSRAINCNYSAGRFCFGELIKIFVSCSQIWVSITMSGNHSYNKDNIRRYVTEGGRVIMSASKIQLGEISRKWILG